MLFAYLILIFSFFCVYIYWKLTFWKRRGIPNDIASIYNRFLEPFHISDYRAYRKYGKIVGTYDFLKPSLMIGDASLIKTILITDFEKFPNHRPFAENDQISGKNIFLLKSNEWMRVRRILSNSFTTKSLKKLIPFVDICAKNLTKKYSYFGEQRDTVDVKKQFDQFTIDSIIMSVFGFTVNEVKDGIYEDKENVFVKHANNIFPGRNWLQVLSIVIPKLRQILGIHSFGYNEMLFFKKLVEKRLTEIVENENDNNYCLLRSFLHFGEKGNSFELRNEENKDEKLLTKEEIVDQCLVFMIAGFDTITSALSYIALLLACHPSEQEKLIKEVDSVCGEKESINYEELMYNSPVMDSIIWETLRYIPTVNRTERVCTEDCYLNDIFVPKGTVITVPMFSIHHDPCNYEDPDQFKPERFYGKNYLTIRNENTYLPFALGPRNCIGMRLALLQMKICLFRMYQKVKFLNNDKNVNPQVLPEMRSRVTISTPKGIQLQVIPR